MPNVLGDSENYVIANPMQTPAAIPKIDFNEFSDNIGWVK